MNGRLLYGLRDLEECGESDADKHGAPTLPRIGEVEECEEQRQRERAQDGGRHEIQICVVDFSMAAWNKVLHAHTTAKEPA
jgi:hypothetical protein